MGSFIADYHETEEALPLVYNLGRLSLEWNMVEQFFTALIWEFLGDYPTGMAVTGGMGNQSKADVIVRIARERIRDSETIDRIEFACKAFNILRENRNVLIHSHSIFRSEVGGKPHWRRATGKAPHAHASTEADFEDLENIIAQICQLGIFVTGLTPFLSRKNLRRWRGSEPPTLPDKFALPLVLSRLPEEAPPVRKKRKSPSGKARKTP